MKKSFIFGITMVLTLLLVFAGCDVSTSSSGDDDNKDPSLPSGPQQSLQSDLSTIAAAFGDGAEVVNVGSTLYLNGGELVIPPGKTLDFVQHNVSISGLTDNSKIIAGANSTLNYPAGQTVRWSLLKDTAKLIVSPGFKDRFVWVEEDGLDPGGRPIHARNAQIVLIQDWDVFAAWNGTDTDGAPYIYDGAIVALTAPASIGGSEADHLAKKAGGLNLYIVGNKVTLASYIDLTAATTVSAWRTPSSGSEEASPQILANYNPNLDGKKGTLVIAGDALVTNTGSVKANGFTVLGVLNKPSLTSGEGVITVDGTPFVGYTARVTGATFNGSVDFIGAGRNDFGGAVIFSDSVNIKGPVAFEGVTFKGAALFSGEVTFSSGSVQFADSEQLLFGGDLVLWKEVTFPESFEYAGKLKLQGFKPTTILQGSISKAEVSGGGSLTTWEFALTEGSSLTDIAKFIYPTRFTTPITIGTSAVFEAPVVFTEKITIGTDAAALKSSPLPDFKAATSVTIEKGADFQTGVDFGTVAIPAPKGKLRFGSTSKFDATDKKTPRDLVLDEAEFGPGTHEGIAKLTVGGITIDSDEGVGSLAFTVNTAATKDVGSSSLVLESKALTINGYGGYSSNSVFTLNNSNSIVVGKDGTLAFVDDKGGVTYILKGRDETSGSFLVTTGTIDFNPATGDLTGDTNKAVLKNTANLVIPRDYTLTIRNATLDISEKSKDGGGIITFGSWSSGKVGTYSAINFLKTGGIKAGATFSDGVIVAGLSDIGSVSIVTGTVATLSNGAGTNGAAVNIGSKAQFGTLGRITGEGDVIKNNATFIYIGTQALWGSQAAQQTTNFINTATTNNIGVFRNIDE